MSETMALTPILSEHFNDMNLEVYYIDGEPWYTRDQIAKLLGYGSSNSVAVIHKRHANRLDPLSVTYKLSSTDGKLYDTYLYSFKGVLEICRWARTPAADAAIDFVFGTFVRVTEMVKAGELEAAKVWGLEQRKLGIEEGHALALQQVKEELDEKERRMAELAGRMKEMGPSPYYHELREIWGDDWARIDLEMRKRNSMEEAEAEKLGLSRGAWVYGMQNRVINDLDKYVPKEV